ncbi:hypothetical protein [Thermomonospora umbrina]|uniref:Uncharacterized protein n=1 Tax=Thermomonospora umbrina TaxID=111806 RepID=A0A3D9SLZ2_9ACTN|nr:hypothetical protein [Thermomonospora umbrina]REE96868.1 hypothetical protein DFJ69_2321 [Thermomonospora umbrina]
MMRGLTRALVALPLALTLTLTACGGDDGGDEVASGGGPQKNAGGTGEKLDQHAMGVKFAQCMRENGIPLEDPKPGEGIMLKFDQRMKRETVDKAMQACRKYNPQQNGAGGSDPKAEERSRAFSQCMRDNGVEKFPDPKPGQRGIMIDRNAIGDDPDFDKAQQACQKMLQGGQ